MDAVKPKKELILLNFQITAGSARAEALVDTVMPESSSLEDVNIILDFRKTLATRSDFITAFINKIITERKANSLRFDNVDIEHEEIMKRALQDAGTAATNIKVNYVGTPVDVMFENYASKPSLKNKIINFFKNL